MGRDVVEVVVGVGVVVGACFGWVVVGVLWVVGDVVVDVVGVVVVVVVVLAHERPALTLHFISSLQSSWMLDTILKKKWVIFCFN